MWIGNFQINSENEKEWAKKHEPFFAKTEQQTTERPKQSHQARQQTSGQGLGGTIFKGQPL